MNPVLIAVLVIAAGIVLAIVISDAVQYRRQVKNPRPGRIL